MKPNTFEHTHCHCSSYLRIRPTFTGILREKKILLKPSYSVITINYVSVAKLWNALSGKKTIFFYLDRLGIFRYRYLLLCNFPVQFAYQNFTDFEKQNSFLQIFYGLISWEYFDQILGQFVKFSCLINLFKEGTFAEKRDRFFASKVLEG